MNILIKSATIIDPNSSLHGKKRDLLIERGIITEIGANLKADKSVKVVESADLHVSAGWIDMQVNFRDPGHEQKENITTGLDAAAHGGFTAVCIMPGTNPPIHSKSQVEYIINKAKDHLVTVYPIGCISHDREGKDMAEMFDMKSSGAVAFSDDKRSIEDSGLLLRSLQYANNIGSFLITHCDDQTISGDGKMNEGETATKLGLKGIPGLAEELMVQRNIAVLEYTGGKLHLPIISTKKSVEMVKHAKSKGLNISAGVAAHLLFFDDTALSEFDTNFKTSPPLRSKEDVEALKKGLSVGTIDVIVSDHSPEDIENKDVEFDHASFGMIGLESFYGATNSALNKLDVEVIIEKFTGNPRKILGITAPLIKENEKANLTIFDPSITWKFEHHHIHSKSKNTPFIGATLKGKVIGAINNGKTFITK